jgi:hypothetical protein
MPGKDQAHDHLEGKRRVDEGDGERREVITVLVEG